MSKLNDTESANCANGGGKMDLRYFLTEYRSVIIFGLVLSVIVIISNLLTPLIPKDFYVVFLSPAMNCFLISFCGCSAWIMYNHNDGIRVRKLVSLSYAIWTVMLIIGLWVRAHYHAFGVAEGLMSIRGWEMVFGNIFAWLLLAYPTEVLRPGWQNWKRAALQLLPVIILGVIDEITNTDLRWILAFYPMIYIGTLLFHIRAYRQWCEENYSSMENIDTQWIVQYLVMILIVGVSYTYMCFNKIPTRTFTQEWLLFFIFVYSTEKIMFRPDPWKVENNKQVAGAKRKIADNKLKAEVEKQRAETEKPKEENTEEAVSETENKTEAIEDMNEGKEYTNENNAEYRAALEEWMKSEKPYLNADFRLQDLREILPMNRTYLSHFLRTEFGCNFYQYVTQYRVEEAKRLLRENPEMKMQDISDQCGFSSLTMFGRVFARETGISPSDWNAHKN